MVGEAEPKKFWEVEPDSVSLSSILKLREGKLVGRLNERISSERGTAEANWKLDIT